MSIFCHVTGVFHWKIFATVFLCFIAGKWHRSVNMIHYWIYIYRGGHQHSFRKIWEHIAYKLQYFPSPLSEKLVCTCSIYIVLYIYARYPSHQNIHCTVQNNICLINTSLYWYKMNGIWIFFLFYKFQFGINFFNLCFFAWWCTRIHRHCIPKKVIKIKIKRKKQLFNLQKVSLVLKNIRK